MCVCIYVTCSTHKYVQQVLIWSVFMGGWVFCLIYTCVFAYLAVNRWIVSYERQKVPIINKMSVNINMNMT